MPTRERQLDAETYLKRNIIIEHIQYLRNYLDTRPIQPAAPIRVTNVLSSESRASEVHFLNITPARVVFYSR